MRSAGLKQLVSSWELSAKRARERFAFWEMRFVRYSVLGSSLGGEAIVVAILSSLWRFEE